MMTNRQQAGPSIRHCFGVAIVCTQIALGGCASTPQQADSNEQARLQAAYEAAVHQAAVIGPNDVRQLRSIPSSTTSLRVVTWTTRPDKFPVDENVQLERDVWVTVEPDLRDKCRVFAPENSQLALQQLLGLPPKADESRVFAVLEVSRADIFRPCGDPDPAKNTCGPDIPADAPAEHAVWIGNQMAGSYRQPNGFPWTRMGFTYNWRFGEDRFGVSEFVVRKGARVQVLQRYTTEAYCR